MANVIIRSIGLYHPEKRVSNEELLERIDSNQDTIKNIWESWGKFNRYLGSDEETTLTMAVESAREALSLAKLKGEDMDLVVVSSGTHEYSVPTDAAFVHKAIEGKTNCVVYDTNANCVGMVVSYDQISRMMIQNPKIKKALLIGSEQLGRFYNPRHFASEGLSGEAACAIVLERVEEDEGRGFIDSEYFTYTDRVEDLKLPGYGFSNTIDNSFNSRVVMSDTYTVDVAFPTASENINKLLNEHRIVKDDVSKYFLSQLNIGAISRIAEDLDESFSKFTYIGDEYGYTGTTSPFLALYHSIKDGTISKGETFVMWSVGSGITSCAVLARL